MTRPMKNFIYCDIQNYLQTSVNNHFIFQDNFRKGNKTRKEKIIFKERK